MSDVGCPHFVVMVASDRIIWHIPDQMSDEEIQAEPVFDDFILAKRAEASAVQMEKRRRASGRFEIGADQSSFPGSGSGSTRRGSPIAEQVKEGLFMGTQTRAAALEPHREQARELQYALAAVKDLQSQIATVTQQRENVLQQLQSLLDSWEDEVAVAELSKSCWRRRSVWRSGARV
jgi:hypothetical protein